MDVLPILPDRQRLTLEEIREWATGLASPCAEAPSENNLGGEGDGSVGREVDVQDEPAKP